ncbi:MAG: thiamine-phosphate kinase [Bacteroidia bacterium]
MFENKENRTELEQLGEFGLIEHIAKSIIIRNSETKKGIGDDAAVIDNKGYQTVVTTDLLLEGVHFDLTYCPLRHLGYKAVVVNVSDIYAMNAIPKQITVGLALSNRFSLEAIEELYEGMEMACEKYGVDLVGGDTTTSTSGLVLSVTAIGKAKEDDLVYRDGAKETDLVCVTGDLGAAYLGLQLLNREKQVYLDNPKMQPDFAGYDYLLERQLKPEAQKEIIELLKTIGVKPTSMIDISDGLSSELYHICSQSKTGCRIYEEKIPIDVKSNELAEEFNLNPLTCALNGGEDYELLFTVNIGDFDKIKNQKDIHIIGHVTDAPSGLFLVTNSNQEFELKAQGWDGLK